METFQTTDGRVLTYRAVGAGSVLVCHPGGPGFSSWYFGDLGGLGQHLSLMMLNPRGTGGSDRPRDPRAYGIEDYVVDLDEFRIHLGLEQMNLFGHSFGGIVAMEYAAGHPKRVARLILASAPVRFAAEHVAAMERLMQARANEPWYADARAAFDTEESGDITDEEAAETYFRKLPFFFARYGEAEAAYAQQLRAMERLNADARRLFFREIWRELDLRPMLPRITATTLCISGEADIRAGPQCAAEIAAGIRHVKIVMLPEVGHVIFVEARDSFRDEVLSFLGVA